MAYIPPCKFDTAGVGFDVGVFDSGLLTQVESLTIADSIIKSAIKILGESLLIADSPLVRLILSESIGVVDLVQRNIGKLFNEVFSIADSVYKSAVKNFLESAACKFDTVGLGFDESVFDVGSPHIVDSFLIRLLMIESVNVADSIQLSVTKLLNETVLIADAFTKSVINLFNETVNITDGIHFKVFVNEIVQILDSISTIAEKVLVESFGTADNIIRSAGILLAESFSVTEDIVTTAEKWVVETLSIVDSIYMAGVEAFAESIAVVDTVYRSGQKLLSESVSVIDTLIITVVLEFDEILRIIDSVIKKRIVKIRKIFVRVRGGRYESDIELED